MTIRAVIWDMGGVLIRTEDPAPRTDLARRLGLSRQELEEAVFNCDVGQQATLGQAQTRELWVDVCLRLGTPVEQAGEVETAFWGGDRLDTELLDYVRRLRPRYRTALLSNAWPDARLALSQRWQMLDAFDEIIISAEVGLMKPDPRIFELAVLRLKVAPQEAVFIDDFALNVRAARECGLQGIRFQNTAQVKVDLEALLA